MGLCNNNLGERNGSVSSDLLSAWKASKMVKEKESLLFHWICKFARRKKVGMLLLCLVSAAVFLWVLNVGKDRSPL